MAMPAATTLLPGFADPPIESQRVFRAVLDAMARPGTATRVPATPATPPPLDPATGALLLALADQDTPVWLDHAARNPEVAAWLRFHCACPLADEAMAATFAVIADPAATPDLSAFDRGSDEYPDRSATIIVQVPALTGGEPWPLAGPGIRDRAILAVQGLPPAFKDRVRANHALFPRGIDLIFACGDRLAALPRSTRLGDD